MGHKGRSSADDRLAAHVAAGLSVRAACKRIGLSEKTGYRRMADPAFEAKVKTIRGRMVTAAAGTLAKSMSRAGRVLAELLKETDGHLRHKAATKILELGLKVAEVADLQERIAKLEAAQNPAGGTP